MEYHRPQSLDEALTLLRSGIPLAGGTSLTPRRRAMPSVVDLHDVGLDTLDLTETRLIAGACVSLQTLIEFGDPLPPGLAQACRLEAGWNLRNMATLGGTLIAADGRSPVVTTLLALGASVVLQPGDERVDLDEFLTRRGRQPIDKLITTVSIPRPRWLVYEQVARTPADRPILCAAVAGIFDEGAPGRLGVALGGFDARPLLVSTVDVALGSQHAVEEIGRRASQAYAAAGDAWASAAYRAEIAGVLVRRMMRQEGRP
jgi:CO/xanthine dehydrogenase FAD-binding subunit